MSAFLSLLMADLRFNRWRLIVLIIITTTALFTHIALGAILTEMQATVGAVWRTESPFDIAVTGPDVDASKAAGLAGVLRLEQGLQTEAYLGSGKSDFVSLAPDQRLFVLTLVDGRLPERPDEVTLPSGTATWLRVKPGDSLTILTEISGQPRTLKVVGVFEAKLGNPSSPFMTADGIRALGLPNEMLLIMLDGDQDIAAAAKTLRGIYPAATVVEKAEQYAGAQTGMGIAGTLISSIRNLVLLITAIAVGVLVWLVQRQRSFEFGLLRSIGAPKAFVVVPACLNVALAFAASAPLAWAGLLAARPLLRTPRLELMRSVWLGSSLTFGILGLAIVAAVSLQLARRRIPVLLNDTWGRG